LDSIFGANEQCILNIDDHHVFQPDRRNRALRIVPENERVLTANIKDVWTNNLSDLTIAAGATSGTVALAAPGDDVYDDATTLSATIASASGGGFDVLNVDATPATTAITDTVNNTTVSLTASPSVAEGGLITYTASLNAPAQSAVNVTLSNGATIAIAAGASA
jgi:hypothetical protein